jgi:hypothetical protein
MTAVADADSRQYRFGFVANSWEELPADFGVRDKGRGFVSALFLPRHDAGWFGRSLYPPRTIFLYDDALEIRAHPASGEEPAQIPLRELQFLELGRILLQGWLRLGSEHGDRNLQFNNRDGASVRRFLAPLRFAFLPQVAVQPLRRASFGQPLDLKFTNACFDELMPGEEALVQFFQPSRRSLRRLGPFKRESWSSADLVAITNRRLLWITERHRGRREPYGTIARFAPLKAVSGYACSRSETGVGLAIALRSSVVWRIPVPGELEDEARAFVQAAEFR